MTERFFRFIIGASMLCALYFDLHGLMYGLIALMLFEGVTNWRLPVLIARLRGLEPATAGVGSHLSFGTPVFRIRFDAERAWRLLTAGLLVLTYVLYYEQTWFFPWFMGFAMTGAGISGVCPALISLQFLGFR